MFSDGDVETGPSSKLLRRFSDHWQQENPGDSMQRGLAAKIADDRNRERSSSLVKEPFDVLLQNASQTIPSLIPPREAVLAAQYQRLQVAWQKFQTKLNKNQRLSLDGQPPDLKLLVGAIQNVANSSKQNTSSTTSGRAKTKFRKLCEHVVEHSNMISMLPTNDKYFSLLSGALITIVQAAANYNKLAEQVEQTLGELGDDLDFWNKQMAEFKIVTKEMNMYFIELYVILFEFLAQVFDSWSVSGWARIKASVNENSVQTIFTEKRSRIKDLLSRLEREVNAVERKANAKEQEINAKERERNDEHRRYMTKFTTQVLGKLEELTQILGENNTQLGMNVIGDHRLRLGKNVQRFLEGAVPYPPPLPQLNRPERPNHTALQLGSLPPVCEESTESIEQAMKDSKGLSKLDIYKELRPLMHDLGQQLARISEMTTQIKSLEIDATVRHRVLSWIERATSDVIWIEGPHGVPIPSQNTAMAVILTAIAGRNDVHCVQYFCSINTPSHRDFSRDQCLMDLLLSLIIQLVTAIPEHQLSYLVFLQEHITGLKNRSISFENAVSLLKPLRLATTRTVLFVIDSFQQLENRADVKYTERLLRVLGALCSLTLTSTPSGSGHDEANGYYTEHENMDLSILAGDGSNGSSSMTKICFTTDGFVEALAVAREESLLESVSYNLEADEIGCDETELLM